MKSARSYSATALVSAAALALAPAWSACASQSGTIGAVLGQQPDGRLMLRDVPDDLAAHRAGLRENDEILLIDGRDVRAMSAKEIHRALGGDVGDPVKLTVVRGDEVLRVTLKRTPARKLKQTAPAAPPIE